MFVDIKFLLDFKNMKFFIQINIRYFLINVFLIHCPPE